jgi:DmsE family decaheme c-type cytochrome
VGTERCLECHGEKILADYQHTVHFGVEQNAQTELEKNMCEACHGPGGGHVENTEDRKLLWTFKAEDGENEQDWNQVCLQCHEKGVQTHWTGSIHESRGMACVNCHTVMKKVSEENQLAKETAPEVCFTCHKMKKMQFQKSSHMPLMEGKIACVDCHNPHGSPNPTLLIENSVNENCAKCHSEKAGPMLWEHPPVRENCLNCHNPHGSNHDNLLVVKRPRLCQRCHIEARHPTTPQSEATQFAIDRGCVNCHSQIHGSNHPAGMRFQR